jgi:hypothetical protein
MARPTKNAAEKIDIDAKKKSRAKMSATGLPRLAACTCIEQAPTKGVCRRYGSRFGRSASLAAARAGA